MKTWQLWLGNFLFFLIGAGLIFVGHFLQTDGHPSIGGSFVLVGQITIVLLALKIMFIDTVTK